MVRSVIALLLLASSPTPLAAQQANEAASVADDPASALAAALVAPTRTAANVARDQYRHPRETLDYIAVKPSDKVVELSMKFTGF